VSFRRFGCGFPFPPFFIAAVMQESWQTDYERLRCQIARTMSLFRQEKRMKRKLRLFYAAGPGDIVGTFHHWREGRDDPSQVSVTYSSQFWNVCDQLGAESFAVSSHSTSDLLIDGSFRIENRPKLLGGARGLAYHLGALCYGLWLIASMVRFRADFAVIAEGTTHWFLLGFLRVFGIQVIPTIHCVLWPKYQAPGRTQHLLNALNRLLFFKTQSHAILSASRDITAQLQELGATGHIIQFFPTYRQAIFDGIVGPPAPDPFRVLFAGRIEENKGVFTVLEIACRYRANDVSGFVFDICGTGSALAELRERGERAALGTTFECHGHCSREVMREMFNRCHVVLVPTTTNFNEGFNQVVVEGVLAGRPVITSSVCPALETVRDAVTEVGPNDSAGYYDAILNLRMDQALYERKRRACVDYQNQFYDEANGWAAALNSALSTRNESLAADSLGAASHAGPEEGAV
jgi:glycosyltransferase involved in cell wall biosynthesis